MYRLERQLRTRLLEVQAVAREAVIGSPKSAPRNRGRRSMPKSVGSILHAITFLALTSGAAAVLADPGSSPGQRGGVMGDTGGAGMMRSMRGMMQGCGAMMQSGAHSGRPNEQWREDRRSTPDRYE